jgi:hypothetical protein
MQGQSARHAAIRIPSAWHEVLPLAWGMSHIGIHGAQEFAAAARQNGCNLEAWPEEQRQQALQMLVHACDIGNPAKSLHSSLLWSERILAENFAQVGCPPTGCHARAALDSSTAAAAPLL